MKILDEKDYSGGKRRRITNKEARNIIHKAYYQEDYCLVPELADVLEIAIKALDTIENQKEIFEWCTDCKEYDKENHCCHRWTKVIRNTVAENNDYYEKKLDKIKFIVLFELGNRHEIGDKIIEVIEGGEEDDK